MMNLGIRMTEIVYDVQCFVHRKFFAEPVKKTFCKGDVKIAFWSQAGFHNILVIKITNVF